MSHAPLSGQTQRKLACDAGGRRADFSPPRCALLRACVTIPFQVLGAPNALRQQVLHLSCQNRPCRVLYLVRTAPAAPNHTLPLVSGMTCDTPLRSSIFSIVGFMGGPMGWSGPVGAFGGILAMCAMCQGGGGYHRTLRPPNAPLDAGFGCADRLLLIGGILQLIGAIVSVILVANVLTAVEEGRYCADRYIDCSSESMECPGTTICYKELDDALVSNEDTDCSDCAISCSSEDEKKLCEDIHGAGPFCTRPSSHPLSDGDCSNYERCRGLQTAAKWPCWQCGPHPSFEPPPPPPPPRGRHRSPAQRPPGYRA